MNNENKTIWLSRCVFAALAIVLCVVSARFAPPPAEASSAGAGAYRPGTYTASADGFGGPVEVTLTVGEAGGVTDVAITGENETPEVGGAAIPMLAERILAAQNAGVDAVSGATFTSTGVLEAATSAFAEAKG